MRADILTDGRVRFTYFQVDADFPKGKIIFRDSLPALDKAPIADLIKSAPDFSNQAVKVKGSTQYAAGRTGRECRSRSARQ